MAAADTKPLAGVRVLVTRPAAQGQSLMQRIGRAGGTAVHFPTLEIVAAHDNPELEHILANIARFDYAIFISPNAVTHGLERLQAHGGLPAHLTVAAIGRGTARALTDAGIVNPITPVDGSDPATAPGVALPPPSLESSEALLARPELQKVAGKRIVIFRGEGGRALLGDTLQARGAHVEYTECYRRVRPNTDARPLNVCLCANGIDIVTVTSVESLRNLDVLLDDNARACLRRLPIVVVGTRQAEACRTLGIQAPPWIAQDAGDDAIVAAIQAWRVWKNSL